MSKPEVPGVASPEVRLDQWLWAARLMKTRSLAKAAIVAGKVRLNGHAAKPAKAVRPGDLLVLPAGYDRIEVEVLGLSTQRGPAPVARLLYRETESSAEARQQAQDARRASPQAIAPAGRPDKRSRRQLLEFLDGPPEGVEGD